MLHGHGRRPREKEVCANATRSGVDAPQARAALEFFRDGKKTVEAQDGPAQLPRGLSLRVGTGWHSGSASPPAVSPACGTGGLAQDRQPGKTPAVHMQCLPANNRTLRGSPAFGEAPCAQGQAGWTVACSHSRVSCWKTPGAAGSGGSVGGTLHPRGTSTFPKASPAPRWPSTLPRQPHCSGAAHRGESCSLLNASSPSITAGDVLQQLSLGTKSKRPSSLGVTPWSSLAPPA